MISQLGGKCYRSDFHREFIKAGGFPGCCGKTGDWELKSKMTDFSADSAVEVRPATREDLPQLAGLVDYFVEENRLLPRTSDELEDLIPFGFVAIAAGQIVGFAALEIYSSKLAEIRSLAVMPLFQGKGVGRKLVEQCVELAVSRSVLEVMAITSNDGFFKSCGFDFTLPGEKKALFVQTRQKY